MKELIYYPTFEVHKLNWLKFALLYLKKINPIIPEIGDFFLSDIHKKVFNETDLIQIHRPEKIEGINATFDAIDQIEKVLQNPNTYESFFKANFIKNWKNNNNQIFTLFTEKYTNEWEKFCLENKLGYKSSLGLQLHKDVANIYMTILAHCISELRGIPPITDDKTLDSVSIFLRKKDQAESTNNMINTAQGVFVLKLPRNISEIPLDSIIKLRNSRNFENKQHAFHSALDNFLNNIQSNDKSTEFLKSLGSTLNDFSNDILQIGFGSVAFGLGVWLLIQSNGFAALPAWKEITGGSALTISSVVSINKTWKKTKANRYARKYLADLKQLA
jgi:hypothetical protein